jgi:hypothetical protein
MTLRNSFARILNFRCPASRTGSVRLSLVTKASFNSSSTTTQPGFKDSQTVMMAAETVHLPYTIQTWYGMVTNDGRPASRQPPKSDNPFPPLATLEEPEEVLKFPRGHNGSFQDYLNFRWDQNAESTKIADVVIDCLQLNRSPNRHHAGLGHPKAKFRDAGDFNRLCANVDALRNPKISVHNLMTWIRTRTRLDLEQGAAAVVSALWNDGRWTDAEELVHEMSGVLACASCWIEEGAELPARAQSMLALGHFGLKLQFLCQKVGTEIEPPRNYGDLIRLLLRIRRVAPQNRAIFIPKWMFEEAGLEMPEYMKDFANEQRRAGSLSVDSELLDAGFVGNANPICPKQDDSIVASRKTFRAIQRRVFRLFHFWKPEMRLRRSIKKLEDQVLYATDWIEERMRSTDDVAQVAFWFFQFQRRLQLKIVSDYGWTTFLAKGETKTVYQNNVKMRSGFETVLARIAGQSGQDTLATRDDTLKLIDTCCLLMKDYVDVYGQGQKSNLVFRRGVRGGSGRGPVDEFNLLCDILWELRGRGRDEGMEKLPGPCYKFLAKDIMAWNNSWTDDAFADNKIHGWELWIAERGL